jgi:hypothetical protein
LSSSHDRRAAAAHRAILAPSGVEATLDEVERLIEARARDATTAAEL